METPHLEKPFAPILWKDAVPLIAKYINHFPIPINLGSATIFENIYLHKDVILTLINQGADSVHFALAFNGGTTPTPRVGMTIIVFGMQANKIMHGTNDVIWDPTIGGNINTKKQNISFTQAQVLIHSYRTTYSVNTIYLSGGIDFIVPLKGHSIRMEDFKGFFVLGNKATHIECIMAYHSAYTHTNNGKTYNVQKGHTWVLVGNKNPGFPSGQLINAGDPVYDYCDPCPQFCPSNIREIT